MSELNRAWRYTWIKRILSIISFLVSIVYFTVFLETSLNFYLRDFIQGLTDYYIPQLVAYSLIFFLALDLILLPINFISGFLIEHRFKMSTQNLSSWLWDLIKEWGVSIVLFVPCIIALYLLLSNYIYWWFWAAIAAFVFIIFLSFIAPVVLLPLFIPCEQLNDEELSDRLKNLAAKAGTRISAVYKMELSKKTKAANAALTGIGKTRRILLSDTLLENFTKDEIEVVMGHELAHHQLKHIWKGMILTGMLLFLGMYAVEIALNYSYKWYSFYSMADFASLPLIVLVLNLVFMIALPVFNFFSRMMEYSADKQAVNLTEKRDDFISSLEKLGNLNLAIKDEPRIFEIFFSSHPTLSRRISQIKK